MQNKGLIRFLTWTFILVCLYQLSFTVVTSIVEKNAKSDAIARVESKETQNSIDLKANGDENRRQELQDSLLKSYESQYLYSKANEKIFLGYTYRQCQAREINLGLDLKGGMNVMLEVSTVDVVRALANNTDDSVFNRAIAMAVANQKTTTNRDFVTLFYDAIQEINREREKVNQDPIQLAPYFNTQLRDRIKLTNDNDEVIKVVREEAASAYDRTYEILRQRIDKFGVAQPTIQQLRASERILVELPGVKDPKRVEKLLQGTAQLEFWLTYDNAEALQMLEKADKYIASIGVSGVAETEEATEESEPAVAEATNEGDSLLNALATNEEKTGDVAQDNEHPLFNENMLMPNVGPNGTIVKGPVVGYAAAKNRDAISEMLALAFEKKAIPASVKFLWGAKPVNESSDLYELYAIRITTRDGSALLDGGVITDARQDFSNNGGNEISMTMNNEGAREWKRITGDNIGKCVAIVLDDLVYSAPVVQNEISGGRSSITGQFTLEEAKDLANILKSGKLPAPAIIVQEEVVGPSLGQESINRGLISFILAFIVVLIYMVIFYNRGGWISVIALITNIFLLMGVLASVGAVLTMPGIAGIVLTLAMAVDGNVIIYERIKEELRAGSSVANAVTTGFKNAYSAIIDGQVTTFLLGLVLIMLGSGPVQGFAVTLCIGIATSLFTSIFITRLCIDSRLNHKKVLSFSFPFSENFMRNAHVDFIGKRKAFYIIAGVAIVICLTGLFTRKLNPGIDFTGGRTYVVRFDKPVNAVDIRASLTDEFDDAPEVKTYGPTSQVKVTTKYKSDISNDEVSSEIVSKLYAGTKKFFAKELSEEDFRSTETNPLGIIQSAQVGPTIANDLVRNAFLAVIGGLIVMFVYIGLRFRSWRFGVGSVVALAHDTILVMGVFALLHGLLPFNLDVDQSFIAAVLTVIGYSINATVVIFDRVREFRKLYPKRDLKTLMNDAINSTLARTINTSGTTFFTLLMMFIFGGEVIRGFIFAILVGVLVGVFSSLCIACPIVYNISKRSQKEVAVEKQ